MNLTANSLIEWVEPNKETNFVTRILRIEPGGEIWHINLQDPKALPYSSQVCEIEKALEAGEAKILPQDSWTTMVPQRLSEREQQIQEKNWLCIRGILSLENPFDHIARGKAVKEATKLASKKHIYALLRKFWKGGQCKAALIPNYSKCGSPGTRRVGRIQKAGRTNIYQLRPGKTLTPHDLELMDHGIKLFYKASGKTSIRSAYRKTVEKFYNDGYHHQNGAAVPMLLAPEQRPSFRQFHYRLKTAHNAADIIRKRVGERKFALKHRAVTGKHTGLGPGSLYQIDSTVADVYLISSVDPTQVVGRPTIYLVVDTFSHLITGVHVTLEHPSYVNAALAIECSSREKSALCREIGIDIEAEDWESQGLPEAILADRGEMRGPIANSVMESLGIRLDNTPAYRPDFKSAVERAFGHLNTDLLVQLPGYVDKKSVRGDKKPAPCAALTLLELQKLVLRWIITFNHSPMDPRTLDESVAMVDPTPAALWHWGIQNIGGSLKTFPEQHIKAALLPSGQGTITRRGIRFKGQYYTCPTAVAEQWFVITPDGNPKVDCHHDPRNAAVLYIRHGKSQWEQCSLINPNGVAKSRSWWEVEQIEAEQSTKKDVVTVNADQLRAGLHAEIAAAIGKRPKTKLIVNNIREARRAEAKIENAEILSHKEYVETTEAGFENRPGQATTPTEPKNPVDAARTARLRMLQGG